MLGCIACCRLYKATSDKRSWATRSAWSKVGHNCSAIWVTQPQVPYSVAVSIGNAHHAIASTEFRDKHHTTQKSGITQMPASIVGHQWTLLWFRNQACCRQMVQQSTAFRFSNNIMLGQAGRKISTSSQREVMKSTRVSACAEGTRQSWRRLLGCCLKHYPPLLLLLTPHLLTSNKGSTISHGSFSFPMKLPDVSPCMRHKEKRKWTVGDTRRL